MKQFNNRETEDFNEEMIFMLKPKIKAALFQTNIKYRADLEQELILLALNVLKKKKFNSTPTFFELLENELEDKVSLQRDVS